MLATTLDLEANPFLNTLKRVDGAIGGFKSKLTGFASQFSNIAAVAATVGAAFAAVGIGAVIGGKKVIDLGGEMNDLSANTGQSVEDLMLLRKAFQNAGIGAESVQAVLGKFQGKLGGLTDESGPASDALAKMGLSAESLKNMSALDQIEAMQGGLAKMTDQAEKANVLQTLFGKSGVKMGALLGDPNAMKDAKAQLGGLPGLMQKITPMLDTIGDSIGAIADKFTQFFAGALSQIGPQLQSAFGFIAKLDFTGIGKVFGVIVSVALKAVEALKPLFKALKAILDVTNALTGRDEGTGKKSGSAAGLAEEADAAKPKKERQLAGFSSLTARGLNAFNGAVLPGSGGGSADPMLSRADRQNATLDRIEKLLAKQQGGSPASREPLPV